MIFDSSMEVKEETSCARRQVQKHVAGSSIVVTTIIFGRSRRFGNKQLEIWIGSSNDNSDCCPTVRQEVSDRLDSLDIDLQTL